MNIEKIKAARALCAQIRRDIEVVERYEEWQGGQPIYGTPQKFLAVKRAADRIDDVLAELDKAPKTEPVAWMVTTRIGSEHVDTMAKTKEAAKQIAIERYRNGSTVEHSEPVPLYLATAAGLTDEQLAEMARLHVQAYMTAYSSHDRVYATIAVRELLEKVRNAAPAAGLTVEEVDQCMDEVGDPPDNPDHFWQWREKFSARLTAAQEAKTRKTNEEH